VSDLQKANRQLAPPDAADKKTHACSLSA
jgi:hypothetical protein